MVLDGIFLSGADLVLQGDFDCVTINCCTLDPGAAAPKTMPPITSPPSTPYAVAVDGRELVPSCLWIDGTIGTLTITRSITGPIRTRAGSVQTLKITDSIIQAIQIPGAGSSSGSFSYSFLDPALSLSNGAVILSRCTVLGPLAVHSLQASECILNDLAAVDDTQHGCIRFSAWSKGSVLPRQFESVQIALPEETLVFRKSVGQPDYCQLLPTADAAILPREAHRLPPRSILAGAENGSEIRKPSPAR